jgi:hypothetical protein
MLLKQILLKHKTQKHNRKLAALAARSAARQSSPKVGLPLIAAGAAAPQQIGKDVP